MNISIIQTCDGSLYKPMLDATEAVNRAYASKHGYGYWRWDGVKRGTELWHSTFNRIYLIGEKIQSNPQCEWIFYIDADAVVFDFERKLEEFLDPAYLLIACAGRTRPNNHWDLNAGVLFFNARHARAREVLRAWAGGHEAVHPDFSSANNDAFVELVTPVDDQTVLQRFLFKNPGLAKIYQGNDISAFNYDGPFIRQQLRAKNVPFEKRVAALRALCEESAIRNGLTSPPNAEKLASDAGVPITACLAGASSIR